MISLITGITWGVCIFLISFGSNVKPGITSVAIALAGLGLILKSVQIYHLGG